MNQRSDFFVCKQEFVKKTSLLIDEIYYFLIFFIIVSIRSGKYPEQRRPDIRKLYRCYC